MPFKPNFKHARIERDRAKREKKAERLKQQQDRTALRKAARDEFTQSDAGGKS